ncbi:hypothetical protein ACLUEY_11770 [Vreelandella aquamarina]
MAPFLLRIPIVFAFIVSVLTMPTQAAETTPSALAPSQDQTPVLTLINAGERRQISRAQIETSPLHEVVLQHFEGVKGSFAGVWLDDFIDAQGLDGNVTLRFIAHDDYTVFIKPGDRQAQDYLLVTRLDGKPLALPDFGPTLLVVPAHAEAVEAGTASMTHWIWSIRDIYVQ